MHVRLCLFTLLTIFFMVGKADDGLSNGNLTNDELSNGNLTNDDLSNGNLTNDDLSDGNLTSDDLSNEEDLSSAANGPPENPELLQTSQVADRFSNSLKRIPIEAEKTLKFVLGFYRHGTTGPMHGPYTGDPYSDIKKYFPEGPGQLTKVGKQQMYNLGKLLRQRYGTFLGDVYDVNTTLFMSTACDRTRMSAELVAYGLYPAASYQKWNDVSDWNPVLTTIDNYDIDKTIVKFNRGVCLKYDKLSSDALDIVNQADNVQEAISLLSSYTTDTFNTAVDVTNFYHYLHAQDLNGLELPEATKAFYPDKLRIVYADVLKATSAYNGNMINLTAGPLINYLRAVLLGKAEKKLDPNYSAIFFSGHDTTLYPIMAALGFKRSFCIDPASALVFEIHDISGVPVVKIFFVQPANGETPIIQYFSLFCPNVYCSLETLARRIYYLGLATQKNWNKACGQ